MSNLQDKMKALFNRIKSEQKSDFDTLKLEKGQSYTLRIVPFGKDDDGDVLFYAERGSHFLGSVGIIPCPAVVTDSSCPICEWSQENWNAEDIRRRAAARGAKCSRSVTMNVLHRGQGDNVKQVRLTMPTFADLVKFLAQDGYENLIHPQKGSDIVITVESKGPLPMHIRYNIIPERAAKPLHPDREKCVAIMKSAPDLLKVARSNVPTHDEAVEHLRKALRDADFMKKALEDHKAFEANRKSKAR